jgi:hypothetical protein
MTNKILIIFFILTLGSKTFSQNIIGKTTCKNENEALPFFSIDLIKNGVLISKTTSDIDGEYKFKNIDKGLYKLITTGKGCVSDTMNVNVNIDKDYYCNILLNCDSITCSARVSNLDKYTGDTGINLNLFTVQQYVEMLKVKTKENHLHVIIIEKVAEKDWVKKEIIPYLLTLIESEMDANCVMSYYSSKLPIPNNSTLGGQVMNLIDSYRHSKNYPAFLTDCSRTDLERVKEIKRWWEKIVK